MKILSVTCITGVMCQLLNRIFGESTFLVTSSERVLARSSQDNFCMYSLSFASLFRRLSVSHACRLAVRGVRAWVARVPSVHGVRV